LAGNWINFGFGIFWRQVQRRGTHVNTPKKGSRGDAFCFGGILGFHAELRREINWGNLKWDSFGVLFGGPRRDTEEGGPFMCQFVHLGEFWGVLFCKSKWGYQRCTGNEVFTLKNNLKGRAVLLRYDARDELFD
jgi:hypothetical protein